MRAQGGHFGSCPGGSGHSASLHHLQGTEQRDRVLNAALYPFSPQRGHPGDTAGTERGHGEDTEGTGAIPARARCIVGRAPRLAPSAPAVPRGALWAAPSPAGPKGAGRRTGRDVTQPPLV